MSWAWATMIDEDARSGEINEWPNTLILFAVTYVLMLRLQQYRPWVALCSAVLFIVLGEAGVYEFSLRAALQAVDYNVLLMMATYTKVLKSKAVALKYKNKDILSTEFTHIKLSNI